jgi:hypothetical protein
MVFSDGVDYGVPSESKLHVMPGCHGTMRKGCKPLETLSTKTREVVRELPLAIGIWTKTKSQHSEDSVLTGCAIH